MAGLGSGMRTFAVSGGRSSLLKLGRIPISRSLAFCYGSVISVGLDWPRGLLCLKTVRKRAFATS
jgi:hypothetical protein